MAGFDQTIQPPGVGRILAGRYRLVAPIARGGMAEVWEAHDEVLSRPVAVKILQSHLAADGVFLERFRREAVTAARLAHPGIVSTFDTGADAGTAFIVMELVRGRNLRQWLDSFGRMEPWQAVAVGRQVADALSYAHQAGLVHRDIKPANILLVEDEWGGMRVKVTDFGIAKAGMEAGADLTRTGMVLGTPKYLSPEQIRGADPDARADLYSLGVVMYEMLVGSPPYVGETDMATALAHLGDKVPKPSASVRGIPSGLDRVVYDLLAKSPDRRVSSGMELRRRLDALGPLGPPGGGRAGAKSARRRGEGRLRGPVPYPTGPVPPGSVPSGGQAPGGHVPGGHVPGGHVPGAPRTGGLPPGVPAPFRAPTGEPVGPRPAAAGAWPGPGGGLPPGNRPPAGEIDLTATAALPGLILPPGASEPTTALAGPQSATAGPHVFAAVPPPPPPPGRPGWSGPTSSGSAGTDPTGVDVTSVDAASVGPVPSGSTTLVGPSPWVGTDPTVGPVPVGGVPVGSGAHGAAAGGAAPLGVAAPPIAAPAGGGSTDQFGVTAPGPARARAHPARRAERTVGLVVLGLVALGAIIAAGLVLARGGPHHAGAPGTGGAVQGSSVRVTAASVYLPVLHHTLDNSAQAGLAIDGNPATAWSTDQYRSRAFGNLYPGIGLVVELSGSAVLHSLQVTSPTSGWSASVYVSATDVPTGQPVSSWGTPTDSHSSIQGSATFDLKSRTGRYVLLWITYLGTDRSTQVAELKVS
ncbi:MAG: serine/threonine protein kinase [Acidobacteriota bacterium]|nr:serine/threonine protein kinase [Acidobacteriota bacterium]